MATETNLKERMQLWHKGLAQVTGAMSLSYFGTGLSKGVLVEWARRVQIVHDDMVALAEMRSSELDASGKRVLDIVASPAPTAKRETRGTPKPVSAASTESDHETLTPPSSDTEKKRVDSKTPAAQTAVGVNPVKASRRKKA